MRMPAFFGHYLRLVMTLTFDVLIAESNQFMFVPKFNKIVNLVKYPQTGL